MYSSKYFKVVMVPRIFWTPDSGPEQAHPWEHEPCSLATCVLPMKLPMVGQHLTQYAALPVALSVSRAFL